MSYITTPYRILNLQILMNVVLVVRCDAETHHKDWRHCTFRKAKHIIIIIYNVHGL